MYCEHGFLKSECPLCGSGRVDEPPSASVGTTPLNEETPAASQDSGGMDAEPYSVEINKSEPTMQPAEPRAASVTLLWSPINQVESVLKIPEDATAVQMSGEFGREQIEELLSRCPNLRRLEVGIAKAKSKERMLNELLHPRNIVLAAVKLPRGRHPALFRSSSTKKVSRRKTSTVRPERYVPHGASPNPEKSVALPNAPDSEGVSAFPFMHKDLDALATQELVALAEHAMIIVADRSKAAVQALGGAVHATNISP